MAGMVIYGKGYLGTRLSKELGAKLLGTNVLDTKALGAELDDQEPEVVINAVGKTGRPNIDWCEDHREETVQGNILAPVNLAMQCMKRNIYFVHLGSGCVYYGDNNGEGYSEEDEPNFYGPQFYAKTKIIAEKILKEFPCLQVRLRMPIDDRPHPRNLIDKIRKYDKLIDIQNSMTTVPHMINTIWALMNRRKTGIYNVVNPGTISAAEIMKMYQEIVDPNHKFEAMSLDELDEATKGKRSNCQLSTAKLRQEGLEMPEIHEAVRNCLVKYKESM